MKRPTLVAEIAVGALILALGVWLALDKPDDPDRPTTPPPIVSSPAAAPVVVAAPAPAPTKLPVLSVRDRSVLCLDTRCRRIARFLDPMPSGPVHYKGKPIDPNATIPLDGCTLTLSGTLTCSDTLHVDITWGRSLTYLRAGDRLAWLESADWEHPQTEPVRWMKAFPGGIDQLSIGFDIGCVLTREHAVWCWSDPAKPRAITVPAKVVEIAVTDLFALCVRTEAGEVSCTRSGLTQSLACDPKRAECGTEWDETTISHRFDPLTLLTRPFHRVAVPAAKRLVAAEYIVDISDVELEHVYDAHAATCTIGMHGGVTCFATCRGGMSTLRVTGLPAVREVRADLERGYAVGDGGDLWIWSIAREDACQAIDVPAVKTAMPKVLHLGEPLYHMGPWPRWETTRCAVTRDGPRCWYVDRATLPIQPFDPSTL